MIKRGLLNFSKKSAMKAVLAVSFMMLSASFSYVDIPAVYADGEVEDTKDDDDDGDGEVEESNILDPKLGRVEFWDSKKITSVKDAFGDNKYHPVLLLSMRDNSYGKASFLSSYSNRQHVYLPTYTNKFNNFSEAFPSVPGNPETTVGGDYGYYGPPP